MRIGIVPDTAGINSLWLPHSEESYQYNKTGYLIESGLPRIGVDCRLVAVRHTVSLSRYFTTAYFKTPIVLSCALPSEAAVVDNMIAIVFSIAVNSTETVGQTAIDVGIQIGFAAIATGQHSVSAVIHSHFLEDRTLSLSALALKGTGPTFGGGRRFEIVNSLVPRREAATKNCSDKSNYDE